MTESRLPVADGLLKELVELIDDNEEALRLLPLATKALAAYNWARKRRLISFLRAFDYEISRNGDAARRRLEDLLESESGAAILADFADAAIRSGSRVVRAALAVLYADTDHSAYSQEFKAQACLALAGLPDRTVSMYLQVTDIAPLDEAPGEHPSFPLYSLDHLAQRKPEIRELAPSTADQVALISDLQNRGLLLRDYSSRFGDGPGSTGVTFGIPAESETVRRLLRRAISILPHTDPV